MISNLLSCEYLFEDSEQKENKSIEDYRFSVDLESAYNEDEADEDSDQDDYDFSDKEELFDFIEKLVFDNGFKFDWIDDYRFNVYKEC